MASGWNGSGTVILTDGTYTTTWCVSQAGDGTATIKSTEMDNLFQSIEDSIQNCLPHDGQKAATANIPMGSFKFTGLAAGSATTDSAAYGQTITAASFSNPTLTLTRSTGGNLTADFSSLVAGTGGVDLTTAQTVAGVKTLSDITSLAHPKYNGPSTLKVTNVSSSSTPTINTTTTDFHYITVNQNMTFNFTWPTAASDTQLGAYWVKRGAILCRWSGASYTVSLNSTMTSALDDFELEGTHTTGSGEMSTLTYTYWYLNGTEYAQFAWVSTP